MILKNCVRKDNSKHYFHASARGGLRRRSTGYWKRCNGGATWTWSCAGHSATIILGCCTKTCIQEKFFCIVGYQSKYSIFVDWSGSQPILPKPKYNSLINFSSLLCKWQMLPPAPVDCHNSNGSSYVMDELDVPQPTYMATSDPNLSKLSSYLTSSS